MNRQPLRTVALLGRNTGLAVLQEALFDNEKINLTNVYTHGSLTKAEGGTPRPELSTYQALCGERNIPLAVLDFPEARNIENYLPDDVDLMIVLSWKFILKPAALQKLNVGSINLHRGELPRYAGLEPVRRAIEAGESRTAITAHEMTDEVDMGPEIARIWQKIPPVPIGTSSADHAEVVKKNLLKLYAPLARMAIDAISS
jgi:methionyl-tRNA formyltransferase